MRADAVRVRTCSGVHLPYSTHLCTRDDARAARQTGQRAGRDVKQAYRDAGGNPIDCRQRTCATKQEARAKSRDARIGNG